MECKRLVQVKSIGLTDEEIMLVIEALEEVADGERTYRDEKERINRIIETIKKQTNAK